MPSSILLAITVIGWGAYHLFSKLATRTLPAPAIQLIGSICYVIAIPIYAIVLHKTIPEFKWHTSGIVWTILAWLSTATGTIAYTYALTKTSVSTAVIYAGSYPVLTFVLAVVFLREPFSWHKLIGLLFVLAGVIITSR